MLALLRGELHLNRQGLAPRREGESLLAVGSNYPWCPSASWVTVVPMIHIHCFAESYYRYSYYDASLLLPFTTYKSNTY